MKSEITTETQTLKWHRIQNLDQQGKKKTNRGLKSSKRSTRRKKSENQLYQESNSQENYTEELATSPPGFYPPPYYGEKVIVATETYEVDVDCFVWFAYAAFWVCVLLCAFVSLTFTDAALDPHFRGWKDNDVARWFGTDMLCIYFDYEPGIWFAPTCWIIMCYGFYSYSMHEINKMRALVNQKNFMSECDDCCGQYCDKYLFTVYRVSMFAALIFLAFFCTCFAVHPYDNIVMHTFPFSTLPFALFIFAFWRYYYYSRIVPAKWGCCRNCNATAWYCIYINLYFIITIGIFFGLLITLAGREWRDDPNFEKPLSSFGKAFFHIWYIMIFVLQPIIAHFERSAFFTVKVTTEVLAPAKLAKRFDYAMEGSKKEEAELHCCGDESHCCDFAAWCDPKTTSYRCRNACLNYPGVFFATVIPCFVAVLFVTPQLGDTLCDYESPKITVQHWQYYFWASWIFVAVPLYFLGSWAQSFDCSKIDESAANEDAEFQQADQTRQILLRGVGVFAFFGHIVMFIARAHKKFPTGTGLRLYFCTFGQFLFIYMIWQWLSQVTNRFTKQYGAFGSCKRMIYIWIPAFFGLCMLSLFLIRVAFSFFAESWFIGDLFGWSSSNFREEYFSVFCDDPYGAPSVNAEDLYPVAFCIDNCKGL